VIAIVVGLLAGFIDSIAGGGGLITLPYLTLELINPANAVGTNKIVGALGALMAFIIYQRTHRVNWREGIGFCVVIGLGSFCGSRITPYIPPKYFVWGLLAMSPLILAVVLNKDLFLKVRTKGERMSIATYITAFFVGMYDGGFGPGGGTFMLLALLLVGKLPLIQALTLSKLANTFSASTALISFAQGGYVHWGLGCLVGAAMTLGAYIGSKSTVKHTVKIVRPVMVIVVVLLIATLIRKIL